MRLNLVCLACSRPPLGVHLGRFTLVLRPTWHCFATPGNVVADAPHESAPCAVLSEVWEGATGEALLPRAVPILKMHGNLTQASLGQLVSWQLVSCGTNGR